MQRTLYGSCLLILASCAATQRTAPEPTSSPPWAAPSLERAVSVRDGQSGATLSLDAFLDALADADVVFLGETHIDETTHRIELAVYEGLLARRNGKVTLAMEMFERDVQPALDAYLAGEIDEAAFLERARPWSNYRTGYRRLIERARAAGAPVVASNFPRPLSRRIATEGPDVLRTLSGDAQNQAPAELYPNSPAYWRRVDNAIRSHRNMMPPRDADDPRLYDTQTLWDNAMGDSCAKALDAYPRHLVLHVNGGFHSAYWDGTVRQLRLRKPKATVRTVAITPVANPSVAGVGGAPEADYVVFAEARATDVSDGSWSVYVAREQEYRLHMPDGASEANRVPLLIWLNDDGLSASDGIDLWKTRLGDDAAIAVIEPAYPAVQPDLSTGGRWFWPDSFAGDITFTLTAIERTWGYLLRNCPIDPQRVCVAGEGTGATVVAALGLLTDRMNVDAIAIRPRHYVKLKDFPLPLPEFAGGERPPGKSVRVVLADAEDSWWSEEIEEYTGVGIDAAIVAGAEDPWASELHDENVLREQLGMELRTAATTDDRAYVLVATDSPLARHWARLRALRAASDENIAVAVVASAPEHAHARQLPTEIDPAAFAESGALPRCPGPFGGTTIIVVPEDASPEATAAWLALEENDALAAKSRFHRVRVATGEGDRTLPALLEKLHSENRENVLIVPAEFCADASRMQSLEHLARPLADRMTLQWLPGLGGATTATP